MPQRKASKPKTEKMTISGPVKKGERIPRRPVPGMPIGYHNPKGDAFTAEVPVLPFYVHMAVRDGSVTVTGPPAAKAALDAQRKAHLKGRARKLGAPAPSPEWKSLTVAQLEAACDDAKIDRSGLRLKAELVAALEDNDNNSDA